MADVVVVYWYSLYQWTGSERNQLFFPIGPFGRCHAAVATDPAVGQTVMCGGEAEHPNNNTWTWDGRLWTFESQEPQLRRPPVLSAASAAFDPHINAVVLFGGEDTDGIDQNSTWEWSGAVNWQQVTTPQSPPPRDRAGIAYLPALGHVILFGGEENGVPLNDTWEFVP